MAGCTEFARGSAAESDWCAPGGPKSENKYTMYMYFRDRNEQSKFTYDFDERHLKNKKNSEAK